MTAAPKPTPLPEPFGPLHSLDEALQFVIAARTARDIHAAYASVVRVMHGNALMLARDPACAEAAAYLVAQAAEVGAEGCVRLAACGRRRK